METSHSFSQVEQKDPGMRILFVNWALIIDEVSALQIKHYDSSFAYIVSYMISYHSSGNSERKTHLSPVRDGLVEREIFLIPQTMQSSTMVYEPSIKQMLTIVVRPDASHKEANHLQPCA